MLAGCGTADHDAAVSAARGFAAAHGLTGRVRCTSGVGTPYRLRSADYLCMVGLGDSCAELRATRRAGRWFVRLYRRDVDCALPA